MTTSTSADPGAILRAIAGTALGCATLLATVAPAAAQQAPHPTMTEGRTPALPTGAATIRGTVVDPEQPGATGNLAVLLYSLLPDRTPGIGRTTTAADGSFAFTNVSGEPGIVYLLGVEYQAVRYGERTGFVPGQTEIDIALEVSAPTASGEEVRIESTSIRIQILGTRLAIQERHRVVNGGSATVFVSPADRSDVPAPFRSQLPPNTERFETSLFDAETGFDRQGEQLVYWGPLYPGTQDLRYSYLVPTPPGEKRMLLRLGFPMGAGSLRVVTSESGPDVRSTSLHAMPPEEADGVPLRILESGALAPGTSVLLEVAIPPTTRDLASLHLGRADLSVELDDTYLEVTQQHRLLVDPGASLAGSPSEPLFQIELPEGALLEGLSAAAAELGISASDRHIDVVGPLPPGEHAFAFRYRIPATAGGTTLHLRFPLRVPTLLVQTADTGLLIHTDRLHRLRPEQQGTRMWLLREAFDVTPDETVSIRFSAVAGTRTPRSASIAIVAVAGALVMGFVVAPLRPRAVLQQQREGSTEPELTAAVRERQLVYVMIRDLDDDFETGKVGAADRDRLRAELRARAIELLRSERAATQTPAETLAEPSGEGDETTSDRFCPSCGERASATWRFCSRCGGALPAAPLAASVGPKPEPTA